MNFKRLTAMALASAMIFAMTACGGEAEPVSSDVKVLSSESQNASVASTAPVLSVDENAASSNYVFTYEGVNIVVSSAMNDILDDLNSVAGEPQYFEAASCADDGMAKTYTYKGGSFTVSTNPNGATDVIANITLYDDTVTTAEGIYIGCDKAAVEAAYGTATTSTDTTSTYEKGTSTLIFVFDANGKVINIIYNAKY